jgi:hypothetical protein
MDNPRKVQKLDTPVAIQDPPYEKPVLLSVGNLRDLLAGSGSKFSDDGQCSAGGTDIGNGC